MGRAEWKKGAHSAGEMNRAMELFSDEAMGYSAKESQLGGFSGSLNEERVTSSILPGMEWDLSRMSGGARRTKKTRKSRKVRKTGRTAKARNTFRIRFTGQIRMKQRHRQ